MQLLETFLILWLLGSVIAAGAQLGFPNWVADGTNWGYSSWQREIGLWNLAVIILLL